MKPSDLIDLDDGGVPQVFESYLSAIEQAGDERQVFFSIGGYAYMGDWGWLSSTSQAAAAGAKACEIAQKYGVGIEIDYEGGSDPLAGLESFVGAFRTSCPMGKYALTIDLFGSPGGASWGKDVMSALLPESGSPGEVVDGSMLDWANVMVIDGACLTTSTHAPAASLHAPSHWIASSPRRFSSLRHSTPCATACGTAACASPYWDQWASAGLNMKRATFGLVAGGANG